MDAAVLAIFAFVYLVMILGGIPGLAIDRTGAALIGAIALLAFEKVNPDQAWRAIDVPTIGLLFGLMVVSAQLRLGGFYAAVTRRVAGAALSPPLLLGLLIGVVGTLSALLTNDIICLAVTPLLVESCARRKLNPLPFLLGLACAANVGSAATLIGNPQVILIGQKLHLPFAGYLLEAGVPAALGLAAVWGVIAWQFADRWRGDLVPLAVAEVPLDRWQTGKGLVVIAALVAAFLLTSWPREVVALTAAGVLLMSRRTASRDMLGLVDWHLLVLFVGLFIVNHALSLPSDAGGAPMLDTALHKLRAWGADPAQPVWLFVLTTALSNIVSNVPAVMLLLPAASHPLAGPILALASTLAGNLFLVGSIANLIVVTQAAPLGVRITWREHARVGLPVTLATLAIAAAWLWIRNL